MHPDDVLAPYDTAMRQLDSAARRAWSDLVMQSLDERAQLSAGDVIELHAGHEYREWPMKRKLRPTVRCSTTPPLLDSRYAARVLTIHVVGAAILRRDRCLIAQRGPAMTLPLKWEFPGGKLEAGETPQAALAREIHEELEATIVAGACLGNGTSRAGTTLISLDVYAATLVSGTPRPKEHARIEWATAEQLGSFDWAEADIPIVAKVQAWMLER
ncbi:MAG: mismatch repair protein MutT [Myxococcaceae bacterium]|nr:mismatch repair protein MutT [Myxococcaceae bacterium]